MSNFNPLSNKLSLKIPKWVLVTLVLISFLGLFDASYLTVSHYQGFTVPCTLTNGCETVLTSRYAVVFGVPLALLGVGYYAVLLGLLIFFILSNNTPIIRGIATISWLGFAISLVLIGIQVFVLHAICLYCMASALFSTIIFFLLQYTLQLKSTNIA